MFLNLKEKPRIPATAPRIKPRHQLFSTDCIVAVRFCTSRLRKKGRRELYSAPVRDFVSQGRFWLHPLVSRRIHFRGLRTHCDLGLRRLNCQIPHTD